MAKKTSKSIGKPASNPKPAKSETRAETKAKAASAEAPKAAEPEPAKPQAAKPKPAIPQRPVPPHQKFLDKGGKSQMAGKGRIFRHQGR